MSENAGNSSDMGSGKDRRAAIRNERHRSTYGNKIDNNIKSKIYEGLMFGYKDEMDAARGLKVEGVGSSIILPVSSRCIGFIVRALVAKIIGLQINVGDIHLFCCAMYRVALALFEARLATVQNTTPTLNTGHENFQRLNVTSDRLIKLARLSSMFKPLANLIDSLGAVNAFGTKYIPKLPENRPHNDRIQYEPTTLTLSNLRETVVALSLLATDEETRVYFRQHNPIPGALWRHADVGLRRGNDGLPVQLHPGNVLLNPDDIIADGYNDDMLDNDIDIVSNVMTIMGKKYIKYVHVGRLDLSSTGNHSLLVSNQVENLRCSELTMRNGRPDYTQHAFEGNVKSFWSSEAIGEPESYFGILHIVGELPRFPLDDSMVVRNVNNAKKTIAADFRAIFANMIS